MAQIGTRIIIKQENNQEILYTTDSEVLEDFNIRHDKEFTDMRVLEVGTIIKIENKSYKIESMYSALYDRNFDNQPRGLNLYGKGERYSFNFDVTYYVKELK